MTELQRLRSAGTAGMYVAEADDGHGAAGQPPEVLASWIQSLLVHAIESHVARMREVADQLHVMAFECDVAWVLQALRTLRDHLADSADGEEERTWFGRLGGRGQEADPRPAAADQHRHVTAAANGVDARAKEIVVAQHLHASATRKGMVDLQIESREIEPVLQRLDAWLHHMWKGVTSSRPVPGDDGSVRRLRALVDRADQFRDRLARLKQACANARDVCRALQDVLSRRAAVLQEVTTAVPAVRQKYDERVHRLLSAGTSSDIGRSLASLNALVQESTQDMRDVVEQCCAACVELQLAEQALGQELAALREQLKAR